MRPRLAVLIALGMASSVFAADSDATGLRAMKARTSDGEIIPLAAPGKGVLVVVVYSAECPISNAYSPELARIAAAYPATQMRMIGVCVDPDATDAGIQAHREEYRLGFPVTRDQVETITRKLGATISPEVAVIDDHDRMLYRGRINDQYAARGVRRQRVTENNLRDAIAAVLEGKPVAKPRVPAIGCPLPEAPEPAR